MTKLYIANINPNATKCDFQNFIARRIGEFHHFVWLTRKFAGYFIGQVFVEFDLESDNERALIELNGTMFMNRKLSVKPARPRIKKSDKEN